MYNNYSEIADKISIISGHTGENQSKWLFGLVKETNDNAYVCEVGTNYGRLSATMALASIGSNRRVFVVDHMIGGFCEREEGESNIYEDFINNMITAGAWDKIIPVPTKSLFGAEFIKSMGVKLDLVYLDGDHSKENVLSELKVFSKILSVGGMIAGDDYPCRATCPADPTVDETDEDLPQNERIKFLQAWNEQRGIAIHPKWAQGAVQEFFYKNEDFEPVEAPENQFCFRKLK